MGHALQTKINTPKQGEILFSTLFKSFSIMYTKRILLWLNSLAHTYTCIFFFLKIKTFFKSKLCLNYCTQKLNKTELKFFWKKKRELLISNNTKLQRKILPRICQLCKYLLLVRTYTIQPNPSPKLKSSSVHEKDINLIQGKSALNFGSMYLNNLIFVEFLNY